MSLQGWWFVINRRGVATLLPCPSGQLGPLLPVAVGHPWAGPLAAAVGESWGLLWDSSASRSYTVGAFEALVHSSLFPQESPLRRDYHGYLVFVGMATIFGETGGREGRRTTPA